jgi:hypothetical protein
MLIVVCLISGTIIILGYFKYKTNMIKTTAKGSAAEQIKANSILNYADEALRHLQDDYDDAVGKGATPEQLSKLKGEIQMLTWVKIGSPYIDPILKSFSKMLK